MNKFASNILVTASVLTFACFPFGTKADNTLQKDTVFNVANSDIIVSQTIDGLTVEAVDSNGTTESYTYEYQEGTTYSVDRTYSNPTTIFRRKNFAISFSGLSIGFVKAIDAPEGLGQEMGKSLELSIDQILSFQYKTNKGRDIFALGIGIDWRNYRTTGGNIRFFPEGGSVSIMPWQDGYNGIDSRLKTFSLQIPVSYIHNFSSFVKAGLAVVLNANTYGSLKSHCIDNEGVKHEMFQKCTRQIQKFTVDFKATVQFCPFVAVYCKYSPMKVFRTNLGPEFTPLSAGFTFFY